MNLDKHAYIPFELTIEQCATWILITFKEAGVPIPSVTPTVCRSIAAIDSKPTEIMTDTPSDEFLEKCIDAMRKRECWGCKSPDQHTLDKCPTHCITFKSNMVDKSKVVKREPFKRDAPFKKHRKRVNAVATDNIKPDSPTNETSGEDLCTTFGHLNDEKPNEVQDLDEHLV